MAQKGVEIRPARRDDLDSLAEMRSALWPDGTREQHRDEIADILDGNWSQASYEILVAELDRVIVGFAEFTLASRADGCAPSHPIGYLEGWFVSETHRRLGVGRLLMEGFESWARAKGCLEVASDTWIDNLESQRAHESLGFEIVDRCVNYRKTIRR